MIVCVVVDVWPLLSVTLSPTVTGPGVVKVCVSVGVEPVSVA